MTMSTTVYVLRPTVAPRVLFHKGRDWLGADDRHVWRERESDDGRSVEIANRIGQNLPAIWEVEWRPDSPWRVEEHLHDNLYGNPDAPELCRVGDCDFGPAAAYRVWFDTAYGYSVNGAGCSDLHAFLIAQIASEVGTGNILWHTGEVTDTYEPYSRLSLLGDPIVGRPPTAKNVRWVLLAPLDRSVARTPTEAREDDQ